MPRIKITKVPKKLNRFDPGGPILPGTLSTALASYKNDQAIQQQQNLNMSSFPDLNKDIKGTNINPTPPNPFANTLPKLSNDISVSGTDNAREAVAKNIGIGLDERFIGNGKTLMKSPTTPLEVNTNQVKQKKAKLNFGNWGQALNMGSAIANYAENYKQQKQADEMQANSRLPDNMYGVNKGSDRGWYDTNDGMFEANKMGYKGRRAYGGLVKAADGILVKGDEIVNKAFLPDIRLDVPTRQTGQAAAQTEAAPSSSEKISLSGDFNNYAQKAQTYISKVNPNTDITGEMLAAGAQKAFKATGKVVPVELALAQLQQEGYLAKGKGNKPQRTKNPFNVGNTDSGATVSYSTLQPGVDKYFNLLAKHYLNVRTPDELLNNFVNSSGNRYASDKGYESGLKNIIKNINQTIGQKDVANNTNMKIRITGTPGQMAEGGQPPYSGQSDYGLYIGQRNLYKTMAKHPYEDSSNSMGEQKNPDSPFALEAEGGETILRPDGTHMDIVGPRHTNGGVKLTKEQAPEGSFIYSDTKKMKIKDPNILKHFGKPAGKAGGITPADLAKQYDVNKYRAILQDPTRDKLSKDTAKMMVENYEKKLAQLALIQESIKGFPQGVPEVAKGLVSQQGGEQSAQAAYGGMFAQGGMPQYQVAGRVTHPNQTYIKYPGDTLTNDQLRAAQIQMNQFATPGNVNPRLIKRDPNYLNKFYPPQGTVIANMSKNGQPTSDLQDYADPNTHSSLYKLSPKDIAKMKNNPLGMWDSFTSSFTDAAQLPSPYKKENGGPLDKYQVGRQITANNTGEFNPYDPTGIKKLLADAQAGKLVPAANQSGTAATGPNPNAMSYNAPEWFKPWINSKTKAGRTSPTGKPTTFDAKDPNKFYVDYNYWKGMNGNNDFNSPEEFQNFVYDYVNTKDPAAIDKMWTNWGTTNKGKKFPTDKRKAFADKFFGARTAELMGWKQPPVTTVPPTTTPPPVTLTPPVTTTPPLGITPPATTPPSTTPINPGWTNIDKRNYLNAGADYATLKKYHPYATNVQPVLPEFTPVDWRGQAAALQSSVNAAANQLGTYTPGQGMASNLSALAGQQAENLGKAISGVDQYNAQGNTAMDLQRANMLNTAAAYNAQNADKMAAEENVYDDRFRTAERLARKGILKTRNQGEENAAKLYNTNITESPYYTIDPATQTLRFNSDAAKAKWEAEQAGGGGDDLDAQMARLKKIRSNPEISGMSEEDRKSYVNNLMGWGSGNTGLIKKKNVTVNPITKGNKTETTSYEDNPNLPAEKFGGGIGASFVKSMGEWYNKLAYISDPGQRQRAAEAYAHKMHFGK
jgi:hypothetical protein